MFFRLTHFLRENGPLTQFFSGVQITLCIGFQCLLLPFAYTNGFLLLKETTTSNVSANKICSSYFLKKSHFVRLYFSRRNFYPFFLENNIF
jgi:hypothetical protein